MARAQRINEMDLKTVLLAIPLSMVGRYLANQVAGRIIARWPVLQEILPRSRWEENRMLKINFSETPAEEKWILHGQLTDPWVHEFRSCWKKYHRRDAGRACIVDLNEVTLIDKCGEQLLRILARGGAQFAASGVYTKHILGQITARVGTRRSVPES